MKETPLIKNAVTYSGELKDTHPPLSCDKYPALLQIIIIFEKSVNFLFKYI